MALVPVLRRERILEDALPAVRGPRADRAVVVVGATTRAERGRPRERLHVDLFHVELRRVVTEVEDDGLGNIVSQ